MLDIISFGVYIHEIKEHELSGCVIHNLRTPSNVRLSLLQPLSVPDKVGRHFMVDSTHTWSVNQIERKPR